MATKKTAPKKTAVNPAPAFKPEKPSKRVDLATTKRVSLVDEHIELVAEFIDRDPDDGSLGTVEFTVKCDGATRFEICLDRDKFFEFIETLHPIRVLSEDITR